jgi:Putative nucleotidyltransferase DUF294
MPCPSHVTNCAGPEGVGPTDQIPTTLCHVCRGKVNMSRRRRSIDLRTDTSPVDELQSGWTERSLKIVQDLYDEMWQVKPAPCDYAFCLTGSGARMEACPYSDMDAFIVLDTSTPAIRQRFTEVSMYVKANLAAMNVRDPHRLQRGALIKGFVFCNGGLNPLGIKEIASDRAIIEHKVAELTDTAPKLAGIVENYYSNPANQQNKDLTHIVQGMQETSFGFGAARLHKRLAEEVDLVMGKSDWRFLSLSGPTRKQKMGLALLEEAGTKVEFDLPRRAEPQYHIKQKFIRVPQFVLKGLCWYYNTTAPDLSSWSLIEQLQQDKRLHPNKAKLFKETLTMAHKVRIKSHLHTHQESDLVQTHDSPFRQMVPDYAMTDGETQALHQAEPHIKRIRELARQFVQNKKKTFGKRNNPFASA